MGDDYDNNNNKPYESDGGTWDFVGDDDTQIFDSQFSDSPTSLMCKKIVFQESCFFLKS